MLGYQATRSEIVVAFRVVAHVGNRLARFPLHLLKLALDLFRRVARHGAADLTRLALDLLSHSLHSLFRLVHFPISLQTSQPRTRLVPEGSLGQTPQEP